MLGLIAGQTPRCLQTDFQCCKRTSVHATWFAWTHSLSKIPKPTCVVSTYGRSSARHSSWFPLHVSCTASKKTCFAILGEASQGPPARQSCRRSWQPPPRPRLLKAVFSLVGSHPVCCLRVASALCVRVLLRVALLGVASTKTSFAPESCPSLWWVLASPTMLAEAFVSCPTQGIDTLHPQPALCVCVTSVG